MRLIDADAFERAVMFSDDEDLQDVIYRLRDFPTIEPERKKGRWIVCTESCEETFHTGSRCSACNYWKPMGIWSYCPNCGAYMGGDDG